MNILAAMISYPLFHSKVTALHKDTIYWLCNMDIEKIKIAVNDFIDLKKAFDTVDLAFLVNKLNLYGFFFVSKSTGFGHIYQIKAKNALLTVFDVLSSPRTMICGVPHCSILGPLFFLIFINDLPRCLSHTITSMYADYTSISSGSETNN
jgi:hypothetical protein